LIREHLAGDLLPKPRWNTAEKWNESVLGTAHLRLVEHGFQPVDTRDEQVKVVESQIDVLGKAFQGMTFACARCHDHWTRRSSTWVVRCVGSAGRPRSAS
jgi:hypothetical protein